MGPVASHQDLLREHLTSFSWSHPGCARLQNADAAVVNGRSWMACTPAGVSVPHGTGCPCILAGLNVTAGCRGTVSVRHGQRHQEAASSMTNICFHFSFLIFSLPYLFCTRCPVFHPIHSMHCPSSIRLAPTALPSRTLFFRTSAAHSTSLTPRPVASLQAVAKCAPQGLSSTPFPLTNSLGDTRNQI
ncbi:hypothetical protein VTK26DRAFT_2160 [Humicola hyalothermophila]